MAMIDDDGGGHGWVGEGNGDDVIGVDELEEGSSSVPMKRKAEVQVDGVEERTSVDGGERGGSAGAKVAKKEGKGRAAKGVKAVREESDRSSMAAGESEAQPVLLERMHQEPAKAKKRPPKATMSSKKKKTVLRAESGSSTPKEVEGDQQVLVEEAGEQDAGEEAEKEEGDKLYCICKTLYDEERMMIACDRCDEWFHTSCMKMTEEQAKLVDVFICPCCEPSTLQRTTWKPQCLRMGCTNAALRPLSRYCSQECGVWTASMKIAKAKCVKGMTPQKTAEKLLGSRIAAAKKREGIAIWTEDQDRGAWLESILGYKVWVDGEQRLGEVIGEAERLAKMERRRADLAERKQVVDAGLDTLAARTKLLQLAEDRVALLEPIGEDEAGQSNWNRASGAAKKSKSKKVKEEVMSSGQPRCGYDERLSWDDSRFHSWLQTSTAKEILEEQTPIDGSISMLGEGQGVEGEVAVCGQSKRKCKRHGDWSIIRSADMEVEREFQTNLLSSLAEEEQELAKKVAGLRVKMRHEAAQKEVQRRQDDALLAQRLANEGTRRAATLNGR